LNLFGRQARELDRLQLQRLRVELHRRQDGGPAAQRYRLPLLADQHRARAAARIQHLHHGSLAIARLTALPPHQPGEQDLGRSGTERRRDHRTVRALAVVDRDHDRMATLSNRRDLGARRLPAQLHRNTERHRARAAGRRRAARDDHVALDLKDAQRRLPTTCGRVYRQPRLRRLRVSKRGRAEQR
jgi:hypothetical protein